MTTERVDGRRLSIRGGADSPRARGGRFHGDDGAVLVEFALVMPVLFLLLFGVIEFGINLNDYQAVRQAARDAARSAVVADYGTGSCAPPVSATASQNSQAVACTAKAATGLTGVAVKVIFTDQNGTAFTTDKVKVCVAVKARSMSGLLKPFLSNVTLKTSVEMRAEKQLALSTTAYADTDPSGANWSWCS
ncbi:MAG TPA: TadE/TadG family type IV pilus assembly protein [Acidimicrobiales bacterium]